MKKNHGLSPGFEFDKFSKLEQVSLSHLSEITQISGAVLLAAANQASMPLATALLLPGPVAVHVDGVRCYTPTELGRRMCLSPQKFNRLLAQHGLQEKRDGHWCPTEAGKAFGVLLQVHKKQQSGTDVLQLKWKESVMMLVDGLA